MREEPLGTPFKYSHLWKGMSQLSLGRGRGEKSRRAGHAHSRSVSDLSIG